MEIPSVLYIIFSILVCFRECNGLDISTYCNDSATECTTITSFAEKLTNHVSSPITLSFHPGYHVLNENIAVVNVSKFSMIPIHCDIKMKPTLICNGTTITLQGINNLTIHGVTVFNCSAISVEQVKLKGLSSISSNGSPNCITITFSGVQITDSILSVPLCVIKSNITMANVTFQYILSTYSSINAIDCILTLQEITFVSNNGGALNITNSSASLTKLVSYNNSATEIGIFKIDNSSVYVNKGLAIRESKGDPIKMFQSCVYMSGDTNFTENQGSVSVISSELNITGHIYMSNNCPHFITEGFIVTYNSFIRLTGDVIASNNFFSSFYFHTSTAFLTGSVRITNNMGKLGAGVCALESSIIFQGTTQIETNSAKVMGGGIYAYKSGITFQGFSRVSENSAQENGGGIYTFSSSINFNGILQLQQNTAENKGGGLYASNTLIKFHQPGKSSIQSNLAKHGGGVYLSSNSKLYLLKYREDLIDFVDREISLSTVEFINNTAVNSGGAIFVQDATYFATCRADGTHNQECFLQILQYYSLGNPTSAETRRENVLFFNNSADVGEILYGGLLDRCIPSMFAESRRKDITNGTIYFGYISNIFTQPTSANEIASGPVILYFCIDGAFYQQYSDTVSIKRGQTKNFALVAFDQNFNSVPTTVFSYLQSGGRLSEGQAIQSIENNCTIVTYSIFTQLISDYLAIYADGPCKDEGPSHQVIHIELLPCPPGFQLSTSNTSCECHSALQRYTQNCDINTQTILRLGQYWFTYINTLNASGLLIHPYCPYDYCYSPTTPVSVELDSEGVDTLCAFNRTGILCGACKDGYSLVLGSSRCKKCSNKTLALIIPIALAGIILVGLILFLNLTVDIGSINGLLLYANIITAIGPARLSFETPNYATVIISWLNLGLGFETCFYNGMDAYSKTWLALVFPIYLMCLVAMIIFISDKSKKFVALFGKTNPVALLATLILLSYALLLQTTVSILSFTLITYPDSHVEVLWLIDPNIPYLKGKHIPLFLTAIVILIVEFTYTFLLTFHHWIFRCNCCPVTKCLDNTKLKSFMDTYFAPFTPKYRNWGGFLLIIRVIVYLCSALNSRGNILIDLTIVAIITFLTLTAKQVSGQIYKVHTVSVVETIFLVNLGTLTVALIYTRTNNSSQTVLSYLSINLTLLTCLFIVFYHIFIVRKKIKLISGLLRKRGDINECTNTKISLDESESNSTLSKTISTRFTSSEQQEPKSVNFVELREELMDL